MKKPTLALFFIIFFLGVALRLYHITYPIGDWHSWRQVDTAAVARNFLKFGFDPLRPRYDDLSNVQTRHDNPLGLRMVEFPLYQVIGSKLYVWFGRFPLEVWLRLVMITVSALTAVFLGLLVTELTDTLTGVLAAFVFAVLPYSVYYGRTILPDPFMVFWGVLSLYLLIVAFKKQKIRFSFLVLSAASAALSLLAKPTGAFLFLPALYLFWKNRWMNTGVFSVVCWGLIALIPIWLWRQWENKFPEGIPYYLWLFNEGNIRFKGAWFYWLFFQRLGDLILGGWGLISLAIGIVLPTKKEGWFFRFWIIGILLYWAILARGNVQHDYYQILILPVVSVYVAKGLVFLLTSSSISRWAGRAVAGTSLLFGLAFSWYTVRTYYWINHPEIIEAGETADRLLPKGAKVIAPYGGDTTLLYHIKRQGWPVGFDIPDKIKKGAGYYVTVSPSGNDPEVKWLLSSYTVLVRNDKFAIIDLTKPL